jgi:monofunctional biosynthetic peptidoglycan transglycosylase
MKHKQSVLRTVGRWVVLVALWAVVAPPVVVLVYRFVPVPITSLMVIRLFEGQELHKDWVPLSRISPKLVQAVIASEDAKFCTHHGFDVEAIEKALDHNRKGRKLKGGSTITQQTAKNAVLWPQRSWVRKGLEAYVTMLMEGLWPKKRIMEVYLNVIEWAPGVYGAEAAAQHHFGHSAKTLNNREAARLAAVLPRPLKWNAGKPGPYVSSRAGTIQARMRVIRNEGLARCAQP